MTRLSATRPQIYAELTFKYVTHLEEHYLQSLRALNMPFRLTIRGKDQLSLKFIQAMVQSNLEEAKISKNMLNTAALDALKKAKDFIVHGDKKMHTSTPVTPAVSSNVGIIHTTPKSRSTNWCGRFISFPTAALTTIKQLWARIVPTKSLPSPAIQQVQERTEAIITVPPYLAFLSSGLDPNILALVDEYFSLEGEEITQSIIAILQDAFKNQGTLKDAACIESCTRDAPLIRQIDLCTCNITISAFSERCNLGDIHQYFFKGISRHFPGCKRLILPPTFMYTHLTRRNAFVTEPMSWSLECIAKHTSMQVELVHQEEPASCIFNPLSCNFDLSNFFTAIDGNPKA